MRIGIPLIFPNCLQMNSREIKKTADAKLLTKKKLSSLVIFQPQLNCGRKQSLVTQSQNTKKADAYNCLKHTHKYTEGKKIFHALYADRYTFGYFNVDYKLLML